MCSRAYFASGFFSAQTKAEAKLKDNARGYPAKPSHPRRRRVIAPNITARTIETPGDVGRASAEHNGASLRPLFRRRSRRCARAALVKGEDAKRGRSSGTPGSRRNSRRSASTSCPRPEVDIANEHLLR